MKMGIKKLILIGIIVIFLLIGITVQAFPIEKDCDLCVISYNSYSYCTSDELIIIPDLKRPGGPSVTGPYSHPNINA